MIGVQIMSVIRVIGTWAIATAMIFGVATPLQASETGDTTDSLRCQSKNLEALFYEDFYPEGQTWVSGEPITITWTHEASFIEGSAVTRGFNSRESLALEESLKSWEAETEMISFSKASSPSEAQLLIGYTDFSNVPISAAGYWTSDWSDSIRYQGTIRFDVNNRNFQDLRFFRQAALHEIGNVLGLGDIRPGLGHESVMNDPWVKNYLTPTFFDGELLRQINGEDLCPNRLPADSLECQIKDLDALFYTDYYPDSSTWVSGEPITITWTDEVSVIDEDKVTRRFNAGEIRAIEEILSAWDAETELISFARASSPSEAQLLLGYTDFTNVPQDAAGYWTSSSRQSLRYEATIRFDARKAYFQDLKIFKGVAAHEIGNVLGLGDIRIGLGYESVMNDPLGEQVAPSDLDGELLRQINGEDLCPSELPDEDNSAVEDEVVPGVPEDSTTADDEDADVEQIESDKKLNAGSFKGYVALYAKGYKGHRLSAKVGKDWVIVPSLDSDFERIVEFTGAGFDINVRMFIDRELSHTKQIRTK